MFRNAGPGRSATKPEGGSIGYQASKQWRQAERGRADDERIVHRSPPCPLPIQAASAVAGWAHSCEDPELYCSARRAMESCVQRLQQPPMNR